MKTLKQNIINLFGVQGAEWIINLPTLITALTTHWGLSEVSAVSNMTFNYVAKAKLNTGEPVVLKISYENVSIIPACQVQVSVTFACHALFNRCCFCTG